MKKVFTADAFTGNDSVKNYLNVVERQDKLFRFAMDEIYKSIDLTRDSEEAAKIAANDDKVKPLIKDYFNDVTQIICFAPIADTTLTKFGSILKNPYTIELLVNPDQVTNRFMADLASVCILQKHDSSILEDAGSKPAILHTRALRYEAINESNARAMTSNRSRDGFYLSQSISNFRSICGYDKDDTTLGFWFKFLTRCVSENNAPAWTVPYLDATVPESDMAKNSGAYKGTDKYAFLAAATFNVFKGSNATFDALRTAVIEDLLAKLPENAAAYVQEKPVGATPALRSSGSTGPTEPVNAPNKSEFGKKAVGEISLEAILKKMSITDLQFVLHLTYTIKDTEDAVLAEMGLEKVGVAEQVAAEEEAAPAVVNLLNVSAPQPPAHSTTGLNGTQNPKPNAFAGL